MSFLPLSMLGENSAGDILRYFFLIFPMGQTLTFHANDLLHEMSMSIFWEKMKNINLSSAELCSVVKVNTATILDITRIL